MRPVNVKRLNYRDEVARRHRRAFVFKILAFVFRIIAIVARLIYLLFFSRLFDVREVSFNGLDTVNSDVFQVKIDETLNQKIFGYLTRRNDIFFVNTGSFEKQFALAYPVFKSVNVQRKLFHGLILNFLERKPAGIWCFTSTDSTGSPQASLAPVSRCQYFDNDKVLWGQPSKSSGFIFLTIEDQRDITDRKIDDDFFGPIMEVAKNMEGEIKSIIIPADSFNEFWVYTADYYIIFTVDFDIQNQLDVLKIFMNEKGKDSNFHPQYIDLRIDGRVYTK